MSKWMYTPELKAEIVTKLLTTNVSLNEIAKEYNIDKGNIQKWRDLYLCNGTEGLCKRNGSYSGDFKVAVIEYMHNTGTSYRKTAALFGIPAYTSVAKWDCIYREQGPDALYIDKRGLAAKMRTIETKPKRKTPSKRDENLINAELLAENQRLRMENEYLKKLNALIQERENLKKPTK